MCQVNTVLGVLYVILIVYQIIKGRSFHGTPQEPNHHSHIRYVNCSKAMENTTDDISIPV